MVSNLEEIIKAKENEAGPKNDDVTKNVLQSSPQKSRHFEQFRWCNKKEACPQIHPKNVCVSFINGKWVSM